MKISSTPAGGAVAPYRHRGLVVGPEDRLALAAVDATVELDLDRPLVGNRVEVAGEADPALVAARQPSDQVACPRARRAGGAVLDELDPQLAQLGGHRVGDRPLVAGRTRNLAEAHEAFVHALVAAHAAKASRG